MKLILATLLTAGFASAAVAGTSDRYKDNRLDTAASQTEAQQTRDGTEQAVAFSTRNAGNTSASYPYANPYGVGPANDSR